MNKKQLFLGVFVLLFMAGQTIYSQMKVGAKIGYSLGKLSDNSDNIYTQDFESVSGVDFGATVEIPISELFSVQPEINYIHRGGARNGMQPIPLDPILDALGQFGMTIDDLNQIVGAMGGKPLSDENPLYADYNNSSSLRYIEIPVLAKFGWGDTWRFFAQVGPSVGFLLKATQTTSGNATLNVDVNGNKIPLQIPQIGEISIPFDAETDVKDDLNTVNFGIQGGIGVIRKIDDKNEIYFDSRIAYGFSKLQKDPVFGESNVGGIIFSLGYNFSL